MTQAVMWSKYNCPYCDQARTLLELHDIDYEERKIGDGYTREDLLESVPAARTVPQIFIDGALIGGYTDLVKYLEKA
jgi:glutaredoxin 3